MRTDALIELLARGAGPAPRGLAARRLTPAAMGGLLASALLALLLLGPLPAAMFATPAPWIKLGYTSALAAASGWLAARAALPVARVERPCRAVFTVVAGMVAFGTAVLAFGTPSGERLDAVLGHSWLQCPWSVLALSLPGLGLALWALRGLAPARPSAAGFAAGLLAGSVGAFGYALSCPESSVAFVAIWYTLGVLLTAALGAALGARLLRW